ncbi:MAG: tetratricopeptide repeat protein [Gemmatimonadota bacterium]
MKVVARLLVRAWLNTQANIALLFGRRRRALELYRQIQRLNPADRIARSTIGNLLAQLGDVDGAVAEFRQLTASGADDADAWFNLGYLLESRDALADAERAFRRAVDLNPSHDRAWYGIGLVLIRADRLREAVDALKNNTRLQPFSPYGWYQLGMTYHHLGEQSEAWRIHGHLKSFEPRYAATLKRDIEAAPPRSSSIPTTDGRTSSEEVIASTH